MFYNEWYLTFVNVMLDADTVINNSSEKVDGSNAYPDPAPKKVGGSGPRKTHRIFAPDCRKMFYKSGPSSVAGSEKVDVKPRGEYRSRAPTNASTHVRTHRRTNRPKTSCLRRRHKIEQSDTEYFRRKLCSLHAVCSLLWKFFSPTVALAAQPVGRRHKEILV